MQFMPDSGKFYVDVKKHAYHCYAIVLENLSKTKLKL